MISNGIKVPVKDDNPNTKRKYKLKTIDEEEAETAIAEQKDVFRAFGRYILATRPDGNWNTDFEPELLRDLMRENEVSIREAIKAFKMAYSDHFTPASGIEWRHLWKHIEAMRMGRDRQFYSYREMKDICDREQITTDHFEQNVEEFQRVREERPEVDIEDIKCWKRL